MTRIDRNRPEPLYHQVEAAIRQRILSGEWGHGAQIPTEEQLCDHYGVSRVTVRQALRNLVEDGYLERGQGRGTFVKEPTLTAGERGLNSFSDEMRALSLDPGAKVLEASVEPADATVSERLELALGAPVVRIRRLRTGDGKPIGLQVARLPGHRFPGLENEVLEDRSLYRVLESKYGVALRWARETFHTECVSTVDATLLQVDAGACAFRVERVAHDDEGPFEYTRSLMRGDRYRIQWILRSDPGEPPGSARGSGRD